ncbi:MAG TPA: dual specificity protein phosphatase family protein [Planctomycetota bacterium]|nr:dual specificity protein phosphatase family protein [Planctomycetota bacterium]
MPRNFSWIVEGRVAGMARPRPDDLAWLRAQGVTAILSLTEARPELLGFDVHHIPVVDMTSPTLDQLHDAVGFIRQIVEHGGAVVAHCTAGMGRTGTILAAYLVREGLTVDEALQRVRLLRPGSVETLEQEEILSTYAASLPEERA